jgi:sugar lactone lactonase YvrE
MLCRLFFWRLSIMAPAMSRWAASLLGLFLLLDVTSFGQSYTIATYAGPSLPVNGGIATAQAIDFPYAVISDGAGGFYVSSFAPCRIYRVGADGKLTVVAGSGVPGFSGDGGPAVSAQINGPMGMVLDGLGNLYFADNGNNRIRQITPAGIINTMAGTGVFGFAGDGGPAANAQLRGPRSVAFDGVGNLFVADTSNVRIRKIDPTGNITTVAGNGTAGFTGDSGPATSAQIGVPEGIAVDASGNLYIAEPNNGRVRKVTADGIIHTIAGNGTSGFSGDGGPALSAQFSLPYGIAIDASGNILISDLNNGRIRKVDPSGTITTVAGSATRGFAGDGGPATSAQIVSPFRVAVDEAGNLLIADGSNHRVRKVTTDGIIRTAAGNGVAGFSGDGGAATNSQLNLPYGVALDAGGNLLIAELNNNRVRTVSASGVINTLAGTGTAGNAGDGGPAARAQLRNPSDVLIDGSGNIFIADSNNNKVRKITPAGVISTAAGTGTRGFVGDNGPATAAQLAVPNGLAVDASGILYITDQGNQRVRKLALDGTLLSIAGNGTQGSAGDGGQALYAQLNTAYSIAVDGAGNLFIADTNNHRIRKVTPTGMITTVVGADGIAGFSGDGGQALYAQLNFPAGVAVDATGNLFIADTNNNRIRMVNVAGTITTIAGTGSGGFRGDGGSALTAWLSQPRRLTVDASGNIFVADSGNHRIRKLTPAAQPSATFTVADGGAMSFQTGGSPAGSVTVGYARVTPDQGAQSPSGFAIFGFRQNNVLVSEASVTGSGLIRSGRIYAEISGTVNTGIAIANPNNQAATVSFFFTDSSGDFNRGSTTIPANGQIAAFLNQSPFSGRFLTGTFTFSSTLPVSVLASRGLLNERGEFLLTTLSVTELPAAASTATLVFPQFAVGGGWTTQIVLVNPTDTTLQGFIEFRDSRGQITTAAVPAANNLTYAIPARSSFKLQTSGASTVALTGSVHIIPAGQTATPAGLAIFSLQSRGITVSLTGIPAAPAGSAFRVFAESFGDFDRSAVGSVRTGLAIANTSAQATVVLVEVKTLSGDTGLVGTISVPGNGQASLFLSQIPGIDTLLTPFRGMLRLTSLTPITVAGIRARYNERNDLLVTTTPPGNESITPPASGVYFPQFADAGGYNTQFVLFSGQPGQTSSGSLQFVSQSGAAMNLVIR